MQSPTSPLADAIRTAIAAFRAVSLTTPKLFVVLEETRERHLPGTDTTTRRPAFRILLRRLYTGDHKSIDSRCTVAVGYDLTGATIDAGARVFVTAASPGPDAPFEGVFDIKALDIPRVEAGPKS